MDPNVVRLCFEVYIEGSQKGILDKRLDPVVSNPIYNKSMFIIKIYYRE